MVNERGTCEPISLAREQMDRGVGRTTEGGVAEAAVHWEVEIGTSEQNNC